mgnify:CR=1 FL=1
MFRVKSLTLLVFFAFVLVLLGFLQFKGIENAVRNDAQRRLTRATQAIQHAIEARKVKQALIAGLTAHSELSIAMKTLSKFEDELIELQTMAYMRAGGSSAESEKERQKFALSFAKDRDVPLVKKVVEFYAEEMLAMFGPNAFGQIDRAKFVEQETERLAKCIAIHIDQCRWEYTYNTLFRVFPVITRNYGVRVVSRVFVTDVTGMGLADSHNPKWSKQPDFARTLVLPVQAIAKGGLAQGVVQVGDVYMLATSLPIMAEDKVLGAVTVADPIDDKLTGEVIDVTGFETTYVVGDKVVSSNLSPAEALSLVKGQGTQEFRMATPAFVLPGFEGSGLKVIASVNPQWSMREIRASAWTFVLIGLLLLLVTIAMFLWFLRQFYAPFEVLEQGVHEVINGNLDYQFPFDFKEDIAKGFGQSLNLMSLILQGRPLPEEEEDASKAQWLQELQVIEPAVEEEGVKKPVFQVPAGVDVKALSEEPADQYYKRLYSEFVAARKAVGLPVEQVNYPKFIERLVFIEQGLKKKLKCPMVRFVVAKKGKDVVLLPVPIYKR